MNLAKLYINSLTEKDYELFQVILLLRNKLSKELSPLNGEFPFISITENRNIINKNIYNVDSLIYSKSLRFESNELYLDLVSEYCNQNVDGKIYHETYKEKEIIEKEITRISESIYFLKTNFNFWFHNIFCHTKYICVNVDLEDNQFYSGSWRSEIGKLGLINSNIASKYQLIEALIHESVHSLFYSIELFDNSISLNNNLNNVKLKSPWTNNTLKLTSFIHACYVWFSLYHFWNEYQEQFPKDIYVRQRTKFIFKGFDKYRLSEQINELELPHIKKIIDDMQNAVKTHHNNAYN